MHAYLSGHELSHPTKESIETSPNPSPTPDEHSKHTHLPIKCSLTYSPFASPTSVTKDSIMSSDNGKKDGKTNEKSPEPPSKKNATTDRNESAEVPNTSATAQPSSSTGGAPSNNPDSSAIGGITPQDYLAYVNLICSKRPYP
jgi:hypothetical protein